MMNSFSDPVLARKWASICSPADFGRRYIEALADRVEKLEKELESERKLHEITQAFYDLAIKERNYERYRADRGS